MLFTASPGGWEPGGCLMLNITLELYSETISKGCRLSIVKRLEETGFFPVYLRWYRGLASVLRMEAFYMTTYIEL